MCISSIEFIYSKSEKFYSISFTQSICTEGKKFIKQALLISIYSKHWKNLLTQLNCVLPSWVWSRLQATAGAETFSVIPQHLARQVLTDWQPHNWWCQSRTEVLCCHCKFNLSLRQVSFLLPVQYICTVYVILNLNKNIIDTKLPIFFFISSL